MSDSQHIFITGASTGIGRACAVRLSRAGHTVFAAVRQSADAASLKSENITPLILDVTDAASIAAAVDSLGDTAVHALINNAGIAITGPLELVPIETWRHQFEVNVLGMVAVTQALLPKLRAAKGRIINIGSVAGRCALPGSAAYDSSKFAIEAISDSLRMETRSFGISVSLIEPGSVVTPLWQKTFADIDDLNRRSNRQTYQLYARLIDNLRSEAETAAKNGVTPEAVAAVVERALIARRPKTRYVIGTDGWLFVALSLLPDRLRDSLILSQLHK